MDVEVGGLSRLRCYVWSPADDFPHVLQNLERHTLCTDASEENNGDVKGKRVMTTLTVSAGH